MATKPMPSRRPQIGEELEWLQNPHHVKVQDWRNSQDGYTNLPSGGPHKGRGGGVGHNPSFLKLPERGGEKSAYIAPAFARSHPEKGFTTVEGGGRGV